MSNRNNMYSITNIGFNNVHVTDNFFSYYQKLIKTEVIPYQWKVLNDELEDVEKSSAIKNFQIAAKEQEGSFYGFIFQDSDVYKWLEAVAYSLHLEKDDELEKTADDVIDLIGRAQEEDGYINTYFTIENPDMKFKDLWECHELYCAGHFFEAAVAYYNATGKEKVIKIAKKFADCIYDNFGDEEGKIKGYDGHQEVEIGLMSLYSVTKDKKYLELAKFFIDERGKKPYFFNKEWEERGNTSYWSGWKECKAPCDKNGIGSEYNQSHKPIKEQDEAVGHAVRVVYMLCGMADIAKQSNDYELLEACKKLWNNIIEKKMYITGAIGSTHIGEAFTGNYDLPNDYIYGETCASIGLAMAGKRMLNTIINSKYADIIEREIYNGILSGISMDGKSFFYVNPLEVYPKNHSNPVFDAVKIERQKWYPCACCPPNIARFLLNIGDYIYSTKGNTIYINQYIGNNANFNVNNSKVKINMNCNILQSSNIKIAVTSDTLIKKEIALRIPTWFDSYNIKATDDNSNYKVIDNYIYLNNISQNSIEIDIEFSKKPKLIKSSSKIRHNAGKIAVKYGPLIYCAEEIDNGEMLYNLSIDKIDSYKKEKIYFNDLEITKIIIKGYREDDDNTEIYHEYKCINKESIIQLVPYHFWGNRGIGEMEVWIRKYN